MSSRLALIALVTLPLAACEGTGLPGLGSQQEAQVQGHQGPPGVSPLEQPIETGAAEARAVATAEAATYNTNAFSARGNEPAWSVDVAGSTAIYTTPENPKGRAVRVDRLAFAKGVEYVGVLNGRPFALTVRGTPCRDSMSGQRFTMSAELKVSGRTERGCAAPASAEVASAVAATRAPAPAAPKAAAPKPAASRPAAAKPAPAPTPTPTPSPAADAAQTAPASDTTPATTGHSASQDNAATQTPAPDSGPATPAVPDLPLRLPSTPPSVAAPADDAPANAAPADDDAADSTE